MGASKAIPYLGQASIGKEILGKISKQAIGYDFIGLVTKLGFFYLTAFILIKYFEAVIFGSGIVKTIGGLAGINLNPALPDSIVKFFKDGFEIRKADPTKNIDALSLMPWDVVNLIAFFLVLSEATTYFNENKKMGAKTSYIVIGIWGLILGTMGLMTMVPLLQKFKGGTHMSAADFVAKYGTTISSTTNFSITVLDPRSNKTTAFIMTPQQVVSLPVTFYVTAGPVLTNAAPNITDAMFLQLFGVAVHN